MQGFKFWYSYRNFAKRIQRHSRFVRSSEDKEFLREVLNSSESRVLELPSRTILWRAQLGHEWRRPNDHQPDLEIPAAYSRERMKPQKDRAMEGRVNPKGIPVLYLSTDGETATSEIRPWLGSLVSYARFKTTRTLQIVNLSQSGTDDTFRFHFNKPTAEERDQAVWTHIELAFSEPVNPNDESASYAPTQAIAELFKSEGYDGIKYRSRLVDDGYNIVLFDLADANLVDCALYEVKSLKYSFEKFDDPYWIDEDGRKKTMVIEVVGPATKSDYI